jgi:hypothetical protein
VAIEIPGIKTAFAQHHREHFFHEPVRIPMPMKSKPQPKAPSVRQRCIAASVMGVLVLIAVVMGLLQGRFNAGEWREQPATATPAMTDGASDPTDGPAGLTALSPLERYTAATLSDKINGKAELYLDAGFQNWKATGSPLNPIGNDGWNVMSTPWMVTPMPTRYSAASGDRK